VSAIDGLLSELRASVAEKQDAPYLRAPELTLLVGYIDGLEAQQGEPTGTEWGVRHRGSSVHGPHDESEARRFAARADYELHSRTAPGPWRVAT
jgi:hypothetical protein